MSKSNENTMRVPTDEELKGLIGQCRTEFVCNSLTRLADLFTKKEEIGELLKGENPAESKRLSQLLREWPRFSIGNIYEAITSFSKFGGAIPFTSETDKTIETAARLGEAGNTVIDLEEKKQILNGQTYALGSTIIKLSSPETKTRYKGIYEGDKYYLTAYIGGDSANKHMLLVYTGEFSLYATDSVEDFSVMSEIMIPSEDGNKTVGSGTYIFTCFSRFLGVLFTEIFPSLEDAKLSVDSIKDMEVGELSSDLLDGCYYHIKNTDSPLTREQKRFFASYQPTKMIVPDTRSDDEISKIILYQKSSGDTTKIHGIFNKIG